MIYEKPNYFKLDDNHYLFFNIFHKNNKLHLIIPAFEFKEEDIKKIKIKYNKEELDLKEFHLSSMTEVSSVAIYDCPTKNTINSFEVNYLNHKNIYELEHIQSKTNNNNFLAMTTICYHDYHFFDLFYEYYNKIGFDHYFIYYNDVLTEDVKKVFNKKNVTLISWPIPYRAKSTAHPGKIMHGQGSQMQDALYRFGKDNYKYMLFCDLDEYIFERGLSLKDILREKNPEWLKIYNQWSCMPTDKKIPPEIIPNKFSVGHIVHSRSKNIYNPENFNLVAVHGPYKYKNKYLKQNKNMISPLQNLFTFFHFYNWTKTKRVMETPFEIDIKKETNNKNYIHNYLHERYKKNKK